MAVRVLVVDDSGFFRRRICEILSCVPEIEVVGTACNGQEAVEMNAQLHPDVVTMDYEMPVMDGITALRAMLAEHPTKVLMFSSLSYEGAKITLEAMQAGAIDFLAKNFDEVASGSEQIISLLKDKILTIAEAKSPQEVQQLSQNDDCKTPLQPRPSGELKAYDLLAIGASTGGPVALQEVLGQLPANFPLPIVIVQHMPASFTQAFAENLDVSCALSVREAKEGDLLQPGVALMAPGRKQMIIDKRNGGSVHVLDGDDRLNYRPSVDLTFSSAAKYYGGRVLALVLTGMGDDGCDGARLLKEQGATVWTQDEKSCIVYGMPKAVYEAQLSDRVVPLRQMATLISTEVG